MRRRDAIVLVAVFEILSGCIPLPIPHYSHRLRLHGRVLDGQSDRPVPGAKVVLKMNEEESSVAAIADDNGVFVVTSKGQHHWFWMLPLLPFHSFDHTTGVLRVGAECYSEIFQTVSGGGYHVGPPANDSKQVDDIYLRKTQVCSSEGAP